MRKNLLKEKIRNGESALGTFVKLTDPSVIEILAIAGFDFFVVDSEHVAFDREQLTNILRAADAYGITPIIRVKENNKVEILQTLDLGYHGVQVPNVDTVNQLESLVKSVKYDPIGTRGFSPSVRACDYGTCGIDEYIATANSETMIVSHCETKECVENIDEILKVEHLDVLFIGPMDLSQSYGLTGKPGHETVKTAIDTVLAKAKAAGVPTGTVAGNPDIAKALIEKGVQYILMNSDMGMIMQWAKNAIKAVKEG